ncbi:MAG: hypothetical protein JST62_00390 [Bacteroidetes bacterium]|nr:hypothetical protein [Bacteroidota bacterium]
MGYKTIANAQKQAHLQTAQSRNTNQSLQKSLFFATLKRTLFFPSLRCFNFFPTAHPTTDKKLDKIYCRPNNEKERTVANSGLARFFCRRRNTEKPRQAAAR